MQHITLLPSKRVHSVNTSVMLGLLCCVCYRETRTREHPSTPDVHMKASKRRFDGIVSRLHTATHAHIYARTLQDHPSPARPTLRFYRMLSARPYDSFKTLQKRARACVCVCVCVCVSQVKVWRRQLHRYDPSSSKDDQDQDETAAAGAMEHSPPLPARPEGDAMGGGDENAAPCDDDMGSRVSVESITYARACVCACV